MRGRDRVRGADSCALDGAADRTSDAWAWTCARRARLRWEGEDTSWGGRGYEWCY
jgi:hypothetical protein